MRRSCSVEFLKAMAIGEGLLGVNFPGGVFIVVGLAAAGDTEGLIEVLVFLLTTAG